MVRVTDGDEKMEEELRSLLLEFVEPYIDMYNVELFEKLPGTEAQRVVRARKALGLSDDGW